MYYILHELKENKNLVPAIEWARDNREALVTRGSNLEFELCRLQFVWLFNGEQSPGAPLSAGRQAALEYGRREFHAFLPRYLRDVQQLMGGLSAQIYKHLLTGPFLITRPPGTTSLFHSPASFVHCWAFLPTRLCILLRLLEPLLFQRC